MLNMKKTNQEDLIKEIDEHYIQNVTTDAKFTIMTIRNLIRSNSFVEKSVKELHTSINNANEQNEKLQKRVLLLSIVTVALTLVQVAAVIIPFLRR